MIAMVAAVALLIVLAGMSFIKIMQSPPEFFVSIGMITLGFLALRDIVRLPDLKKKKR